MNSSTLTYETSGNVFIFLFIPSFFPLKYTFTYNISLMQRETKFQIKCLPQFFKEDQKLSKVYVMSAFEISTYGKHFTKAINQQGLLFTNCREKLSFTTFRRVYSNQNRYPISLDKISILTGRLLVISSQNFSSELNFSGNYFLRGMSYLSLRIYAIL